MKKQEQKDIVDKIIHSLKKHRENYIEGAWENFQRKRKNKKKKIFIIFSSSGIAASILISSFILNLIHNRVELKNPISPVIQKETDYQVESTVTKKELSGIIINNHFSQTDKKRKDVVKSQKAIENDVNSTVDDSPERIIISDKLHDPNAENINKQYPDSAKILINPASNTLSSETDSDIKSYDVITNTTKNRFSYGILVKKSVNTTSSSSDISYAFGIVNNVKLNHRLSLNTGIVLGKYNLEYNYDAGSFGPTDDPLSKNVELICMDIPLNLKIKLLEMNKSDLFIISGVSTLGFIREKYQNHYLFSETTESTIHFANINLSGQLNLSCGWQYHLSDKISIALEGYAKLPLYKLAEDNLHFYQSGLSLKILR